MSRFPVLAVAVFLSFCAGSAPVQGDVFILAHGGRIEGELVNADQQPRVAYVVKTEMGEVTLTTDQVQQVISRSASELAYEQWLPKMPASAEGNWKMAEWCHKNGLPDLRSQHLEKLLEYDPDHKAARLALGFNQLDGQWVRPDEYMESRGYVRHKGSWWLPLELQLEAASADAGDQENEWRKKLKTWRTLIVRGRGKADEARQNIRQIQDPWAAAGLAEMIAAEDLPPLKILLMEVLGRLQTQLGVRTFAQLALRDPDTQVRDKAIDLLLEFGGEQAVPILAVGLKDKDNVVVNRAAIALGSIGHPNATLPLIEALSTKHKFIVTTGGGGGTNAGFSPDGGGGSFTQGGGPKLIEQELPNRSVLHALSVIHRGVNYQYDKQGWKNWYAEQRAPDVANLRRDK